MKLLGAFLLAALWWRYKIAAGGASEATAVLPVGPTGALPLRSDGGGREVDDATPPTVVVTDAELIAAVERLLGMEL